MKTRNFQLAVALVLLTGARTDSAQSKWQVGLRSFGPVWYGMTIAQLSTALRETVSVADSECDYVGPRALPPGTSLMAIQGRIERVDVDTAGILTRSNVGVGSTEEEVRQAYPGQIRTVPHPYTGPEGHYLIFVPRDPADTAFSLIFETDGNKVVRYRAGHQLAIGYIEGCS